MTLSLAFIKFIALTELSPDYLLQSLQHQSSLFRPHQKHTGDNIRDLCSYHRDGHAKTNVLLVETWGTAPQSCRFIPLLSTTVIYLYYVNPILSIYNGYTAGANITPGCWIISVHACVKLRSLNIKLISYLI